MWRHSWSVMRFRPAASQALPTRAGDLAGHDRAVDDLALARSALALPRVGEDDAQVVGDRRAALRAGLALGAADEQARGDRVAVEDVGPFEPVDLRAAQPGVEGDRVGETVLGLQRGEQRRRLGRQGDAQARLLVVRRQLDEPQRVAGDEPPRRRRRPRVDVRRDRDVLRDRRAGQPRAGELVDPPLPVDLGDLGRVQRAELRQQVVLQRAAHRQRSSSRRTACPCRGAGRCGPARRRRATARRAPRTSGRARRARARCSAPLAHGGQPRQDLGSVLDDRPSATRACRVTGSRAPAAPRRLAAAARRRVGVGRAALRVRDVDARHLGLAPVRHDPSRADRRNWSPGDTPGDTRRHERRGSLGVRWGRTGGRGSPRKPC